MALMILWITEWPISYWHFYWTLHSPSDVSVVYKVGDIKRQCTDFHFFHVWLVSCQNWMNECLHCFGLVLDFTPFISFVLPLYSYPLSLFPPSHLLTIFCQFIRKSIQQYPQMVNNITTISWTYLVFHSAARQSEDFSEFDDMKDLLLYSFYFF